MKFDQTLIIYPYPYSVCFKKKKHFNLLMLYVVSFYAIKD